MKGVILAGGLGTRLYPLTKITNKHLLPVYDKPMILYPLETLKKSGITEIIVVTGRQYAGHFMNFLGSGAEYGVRLSYAIQDTDNGGIADALSCAIPLIEGESIAVILGDNIFIDDFSKEIKSFKSGAKIFLKKVADPKRYGVPVFDKENRIVRVEEKPKTPKSNFAQTGLYLFDADAITRIKNLKPSARGELEMTDLVNTYIPEKALSYGIVKKQWFDAGTIDSLLDTAVLIKSLRKKQK